MDKKKITLKSILLNLDAILTAITLSLCVIIANANVIMRYFVNQPIKWNDEVVTGLFVWTVFIGSAYAYRKHAHLGVDIVTNMMTPKVRTVVQLIVSILELAVLTMLTVISAQYVYNLIYVRGVYKPYVSDILRFPKWWIGIAVPIGFGLSVIYSIYFLLKDRLHVIKGVEQEEDCEEKTEGGVY